MASAPFSPRPEPGTDDFRFRFQYTRLPILLDELLLMRNVHLPKAPWFLKRLSGSCGLNVPLNGATACWMGTVAKSSSVVLLKFWPLPVPPTAVNSFCIVPSGAINQASRSRGTGCVIEKVSVTPCTRKLEVTSIAELMVAPAG